MDNKEIFKTIHHLYSNLKVIPMISEEEQVKLIIYVIEELEKLLVEFDPNFLEKPKLFAMEMKEE